MNSDFSIKLEEEGVARTKYYYHNHPLVDNIFTACLFISDTNEILSRGVAICSLLDQHDKEVGRKLAFKRATKALFTKQTSELIDGYNKDCNIIHRKKKIQTEADEKMIEIIVEEAETFHETMVGNSRVIHFELPQSLPMDETMMYGIDYKSVYKPSPTKFESKIANK